MREKINFFVVSCGVSGNEQGDDEKLISVRE